MARIASSEASIEARGSRTVGCAGSPVVASVVLEVVVDVVVGSIVVDVVSVVVVDSGPVEGCDEVVPEVVGSGEEVVGASLVDVVVVGVSSAPEPP